MANITDPIDAGKGWALLLSEKVDSTTMAPEIVNLPNPSGLYMSQDTEGLSPVMILKVIYDKILAAQEIKDLDKEEKKKFAGRMMRSIGAQTADGVAPELQSDWRFLVTTDEKNLNAQKVKVNVHKILDLQAGIINGRKQELDDEDLTVMRVSGACCYFVIVRNIAVAANPNTMKTIIRSDFGRMRPATRACLVIGVSMWARNTKCNIPGVDRLDLYIATFMVAVTSGLLEPLTALAKLIKREMLKPMHIDAIYGPDDIFPPIRAGGDAFAICKGFVAQCLCADLKGKFDVQEADWVESGKMKAYIEAQAKDRD